MHYRIACLLFLLFAGSCRPRKEKLPLPEEKLVEVLIDVHTAEAAVQTLRGELKDSMLNLYYNQICTLHQVNRQTLESTLESLREKPEVMEALYTEIMTEMDRREARQDAE